MNLIVSKILAESNYNRVIYGITKVVQTCCVELYGGISTFQWGAFARVISFYMKIAIEIHRKRIGFVSAIVYLTVNVVRIWCSVRRACHGSFYESLLVGPAWCSISILSTGTCRTGLSLRTRLSIRPFTGT